MAEPASRPRVLVLSTLHQHHGQVACYDFAALERIITALSPDVLLLEVTEQDLRTRADEKIKQEYPRVVYPLLDALGVPAFPLEPSGEVAQDLVRRTREAERPLRESPEYAAVAAYVQHWASELFSRWTSPAEANSALTDAAVREKKSLVDPRYPPDYARVWDEWNEHFLDRITHVLDQCRPRLAVVLVGLEHSYWLRPRLAALPGVELVDAESALRQLDAAR